MVKVLKLLKIVKMWITVKIAEQDKMVKFVKVESFVFVKQYSPVQLDGWIEGWVGGKAV